ncbi:FxSxx-COOH system tetratricopeptide repeat protein [Streptomyces sp. NPDC046832]|uniref:FxSxx-COOH system tetratricopeptide repeat protein n=1 Tax=Streptomyces sp. NPDC046832 TaxID=3155020 RepID=UPI0033DDE084
MRWLLVAAFVVFVGAGFWAIARFGLEATDQTAIGVGGTVALLSLPISLYALRSSGGVEASSGNGEVVARELVPTTAVGASLRPPVPPSRVRGRDGELAALDSLARAGGGMVVICGVGGLGKTALAAQAAHQAQQAGRGVFWVRWQDDRSRLAQDMVRIAQALGLTEERWEAARRGQAALVDVVWEHLAAVPGWVIVMDNVDDPAQVGPGREPVASYRGWLRPDGPGLLIVTSRDTATSTWGREAQLMKLEPLEETAATAVLTDAAPSAGAEDEARALAVRLGGLPLALEAAGRYLATATSRYRSYSAYRTALDLEFGDLLGAEHPQAADPDIARTVLRHTWDLSLTQLHHNGYTLARPLLHLLALLEATPIPRSLITPALLADAIEQDVTATALDAALAGLHQYALLGTRSTTPPSAEDGNVIGVSQVVLHPLVREVMALPPTGTDPTPWLIALDTHLTQAVDETVRAGRAGWPTARLLAPHLPSLLDRATDRTFIPARNTISALARTLSEAGTFAEEHLLRVQILNAESRRLGPDHPDTLTSRNNLAAALYSLGQPQEAADLLRSTLTDRERILGPDHPDTLTNRSDLAAALHSLGQYQEAADLHRSTLTDQERILGPDHPATLTSRNNLATALHSLVQYQEAADLHRSTLTDRERIFGPDHPDTLTSRNNLATALHSLGQYQEAADLHRSTLTDRERILGPDHPDTLTNRSDLAAALHSLGQYQEAADLHRSTLTDREGTLGPDHPDTIDSRHSLATALHVLGQYQEAVALYRQIFSDYERTRGPHHPDTLRSEENLTHAEMTAAHAERGSRLWLRRVIGRKGRMRYAPVQYDGPSGVERDGSGGA